MHTEIELEQAHALVQGIDIPIRPATLQKVMQFQATDAPDIADLADLIAADVSLSAGVLKAVNSPLFGLPQNMTSIQQAVSLLGLSNVINIVTGVSLRLEMGGNSNVAVERFWDTATNVATIMAGIAKQLSNAAADEAYLLGLFHDCGIPLLMLKDPNYIQLLKVANNSRDRIFTEVEDSILKTNHAVVGYYVAKSWRIPNHICQCILNHHEPDMLSTEDTKMNHLLANLKMAEAISHSMRRISDHPEWERLQTMVLEFVDISDHDFESLKVDLSDKMNLAA